MTRWRALATASIWLVLCLLLWVADARPAVVALAGIVAVGSALVLSVIDIAGDIGDTGWPRVRSHSRPPEGDQWARQLRSQMTGARQTGSTALRDRLLTVIDAQPLAAGHPLTPALRDVRAGSPRRLGSPRTLEQIMNDIEAL